MKTIKQHQFPITPLSIKRTSDYHDLESEEKIVSASNIRNKFSKKEDITPYLPAASKKLLLVSNQKLFFKVLKAKILTTPHLENFLTVDEGIENRLIVSMKRSNTYEDFLKNVKTKRYTYNKISRMCIHILLGITKEDNLGTLSYIKILGFNKKGREYLNSIKNEETIPTKIDKGSIQYKTELKAAILFDLLNDTNTYEFEMKNEPVVSK